MVHQPLFTDGCGGDALVVYNSDLSFGPERGHRGSGRCPTLCAAILFVQRLEMSPKPWADVLNRELRYGLGKGERPQSFAGIGPSWLR